MVITCKLEGNWANQGHIGNLIHTKYRDETKMNLTHKYHIYPETKTIGSSLQRRRNPLTEPTI